MKHILVIADRQGGKNTALLRALALQAMMKAKITILGFCYANIAHIDDKQLAKLSRNGLENKLISARKKELQDLLRQHTKTNSKANIQIKVQWSKDIAPAITAFCANNAVDLICKSAQGQNNLLRTSTDWQLIRECPCPVMITAVKAWKKKPHILACIDIATKTKSKIQLNHSIMQHAQMLAKTLAADLHIAFVIKVPQALFDLDIIDKKQYIKDKKVQFKPLIDRFRLEYDIDKQHCHVKHGTPERAIPSIANKLKAELVVTGTVGRKGIKAKLIGNTAESILQNLYTDIVAIKP